MNGRLIHEDHIVGDEDHQFKTVELVRSHSMEVGMLKSKDMDQSKEAGSQKLGQNLINLKNMQIECRYSF